jgi:hypothetical protein
MIRRNRGFGSVAVLAFGMLAVSGCQTDLTKINENPNAPETVPLNNVLLRGLWDIANNSAERGYFGRWLMMQHSQNWVQHVAQPVYNDEDQYIPRAGIPEQVWDEMYAALTDLNDVKRLAEEAGDDNAWAVAEVMSVVGFALISDYFGDIPYTEALKLSDGIQAPAYDAQSAIYPDLIARLTAAAAMFDGSAYIGFGDYDPVYQGDVDGWEKFANSLRLRLAMRMVNANAAGAQAAFEAAWASNIFTDNDEQADYDWAGTYPAASPTWRALVYGGRSGDFRMSNSLISRLAAFNDPRLEIYADPTASNATVYRGLVNGNLPSEVDPATCGKAATESCVTSDYSTIGSYYLSSAARSVVLSYAEVLFLGAEAASRGWNVGGATAAQLYADAITASMEDAGVDAADITTYLGQASVGLTTGTYRGLDAIHVQKWISLFQQGPEAFNDLRRYGWNWRTNAATTGASLAPADNSVLAAGLFPARFPSSQKEELFNENAPAAKTITAKVWWAN